MAHRVVGQKTKPPALRVLQIAQLIAAKQWRRRYPETLLVELTPLLMELLYRQLEVQPASDHCWGNASAPVDAVPLVALAGDLAGRAEELHTTGHVGTNDRGARCVRPEAAEQSVLPPLRVDAPLLLPKARTPLALLPGGALAHDSASLRRFDGWPACCAQMLNIAADFGELTEQAVRELLVAARAARWSDAHACTLALIIASGTLTERAAATLDEAAPGLRRLSTQQLAHESLRGRTADVAQIVRSCVKQADRNEAGPMAQQQRSGQGDELRARYPAVEACAGALEDALARGSHLVSCLRKQPFWVTPAFSLQNPCRRLPQEESVAAKGSRSSEACSL